MTSPRLWGGMLVAIPTAIPVEPFTRRLGNRLGRTDRLLQTVIVVGAEVDGFLVDVGEHHGGDLAHLGFGISVSCRRVAVHRTEVAVAVHQRVAHGEVLRQTHHGVIDRSVAVGMVPSQHRTDGIRRICGKPYPERGRFHTWCRESGGGPASGRPARRAGHGSTITDIE